MLEMLMMNRVKSAKNLVDISFDDLPIGSKSIIDQGTAGLVYSPYGTGTASGVVDDPQMGKCFEFDGTYSFNATNFKTSIGNLIGRDIKIEIGVKFANGDANQEIILSTGSYDANGRNTGIVLYGEGSSSYIYLFSENTSSYRHFRLAGQSWTNEWESLVIDRKKNGKSTTITNLRTGLMQTFEAFDTYNDTWFIVGASGRGLNAMKGRLKYLRISDVTGT